MGEWDAAAEYELTVSLPGDFQENQTELILSVGYRGDAARVYFNGRLLTDNWFSGYEGDGNLQVGLSYLSAENPGLLTDGAKLTVLILPIKKSTLAGTTTKGEGQIFLQAEH